MNLRSLAPFSGSSNAARPEIGFFGTLQREVDRLFDEFSRDLAPLQQVANNLVPRIDVAETDDAIEVSAELPGLERGDVGITLDDNVLTIRAEKIQETEGRDRNYRVTECAYGVFYRTIDLPPGVDPSSIEATMSNGVLKIRIPKPSHAGAKKIEVKEGSN
jgi:HSP20 family protein